MIETISILPVISKPLERHVARSYLDYLTSNTLLHSKQSAYRQYYSCETALLSLTDNWLKAMDSKDLVGAVMLNLSKAFDLVNHSLLLSKISMYHTDNTSLRWFESYLHDRTQRCCINGSLSDALPITRGVPQGSILGPILFMLYINDLPLAIPDCNVDIYADDTTLWMANSNPLHIQHGLQGSLNKANHWFSLNKMVPNAKKQNSRSKTAAATTTGTEQKLFYCTNSSLSLSLRGTGIEEAVNEKMLGVKIDMHLNWNSHIDYMITK